MSDVNIIKAIKDSIIPSNISSVLMESGSKLPGGNVHILIPEGRVGLLLGLSTILLTILISIRLLLNLWNFSNKSPSRSLSSLPPISSTTHQLLQIPVVHGSLPIIGHGLSFGKDEIGFMRKCYAQYGKIFQIKLFRTSMIVICDRSLATEYFKSTETKLSLYEELERLYFGYAFSDQPDTFINLFAGVMKKSIAVRYDDFVPKIKSQALNMIERLKERCFSSAGKQMEIDLSEEMVRFVANTSARCFIGTGLTDEVFQILLEFVNLLNILVISTTYCPAKVLNFFFGARVRRLRAKISSYLQPEIEKYRTDLSKVDSLVLRTCVDYVDVTTGAPLTDKEIGEILVCLLYVSTENTSLGLSNTIMELVLSKAQSQKSMEINYWEELRKNCQSFLDQDDIRGLLDNPLLNGCIMESARLNTQIVPIIRRAVRDPSSSTPATIGNYYIGPNANSIVICPPMLMVYGSASEIFINPETYNPSRFLVNQKTTTTVPNDNDNHKDINTNTKESSSAFNVITWGAGVHLCPGKMFALYEIKVSLALLVTNFQMELCKADTGKIPEKNYFSPAAFVERNMRLSIKVVED